MIVYDYICLNEFKRINEILKLSLNLFKSDKAYIDSKIRWLVKIQYYMKNSRK